MLQVEQLPEIVNKNSIYYYKSNFDTLFLQDKYHRERVGGGGIIKSVQYMEVCGRERD